MSRVTTFQDNMNGGEISRALEARISLNTYDIALDECVGFVPKMEGGLEAAPGLIWVEQAAGPFRCIPFNYNVTQGHVLEFSDQLARVYTNDARIETSPGVPVEIELPYSYAEIQQLRYEQSFDVLYLYHEDHQVQEFVRNGADDFDLVDHAIEGGPFEDLNENESIKISASAVTGIGITITSTSAVFAAGHVGGFLKFEIEDLGDISSWEPGITVTQGQLLTWGERVYQVVNANGRTGSVAPVHYEGVEWDGIGAGTDLNDNAAGGVQLEYLHDKVGIVKFTSFTSDTVMTADVVRRLPFTASTGTGTGGVYQPGEPYDPGLPGVTYQYGTYRWAFGAFSDEKGFPTTGILWGGRHLLAKDNKVYGSVVGGLNDHSEYNELGEITADMAFVADIPDSNEIIATIAGEWPIIITAAGSFTLLPSNQAQGFGPGNIRVVPNNSTGSAQSMPDLVNGRSIYISRSRRSVIEADFDAARSRQEPVNLTRYARHIGTKRFVELASQTDPEELLWTVRADGTLAAATYVPSEEVLGWFQRPLAEGMAARSNCTIFDPQGELQQIWVAVEYDGNWHMMRMAQLREDGEQQDTPVMVDMAVEYEGNAATSFGPFALFANKKIAVVADGRYYEDLQCDATGAWTMEIAASRVVAGFNYPAYFTDLPPEAGGDNGPARGKIRHIVRSQLDLLNARGLQISVQNNRWVDIDNMDSNSVPADPREPRNGMYILDDAGTHDRDGKLTVRRIAPFESTIRGIGKTVDVQQS